MVVVQLAAAASGMLDGWCSQLVVVRLPGKNEGLQALFSPHVEVWL